MAFDSVLKTWDSCTFYLLLLANKCKIFGYMLFAIRERTVESFPSEYEICTLSSPNFMIAHFIQYFVWMILDSKFIMLENLVRN